MKRCHMTRDVIDLMSMVTLIEWNCLLRKTSITATIIHHQVLSSMTSLMTQCLPLTVQDTVISTSPRLMKQWTWQRPKLCTGDKYNPWKCCLAKTHFCCVHYNHAVLLYVLTFYLLYLFYSILFYPILLYSSLLKIPFGYERYKLQFNNNNINII